MSYGSGNYGSTEYAGLLGGAAPAVIDDLEIAAFDVTADHRTVTLRLQPDPVVPYENRGVKTMPSATVDPVIFVKDPDAVKDYSFNWSEILESGETITSAVWNGGGLTVTGEQITSESTYAFIAGGTLATVFIVSCTITTSADRTYCRELLISCEET